MKYIANFYANNGTRLMTPLEGNNKRDLARRISAIAKGERFAGSVANWSVHEKATGICVAGGTIHDWGSRLWDRDELLCNRIFKD